MSAPRTSGPRRRLDQLLARARAETTVRESGERPSPAVLKRLLELSRNMNRIRDRDELLRYLEERLQELFEAENSQLILLPVDAPPQALGRSDQVSAELCHGVIERVVRERTPLLIRDVAADAGLRDRSSVRRLSLTSVLCAPLIVDDRVMGVIQFDHRHEPHGFSQADLVLLELFANQAATALSNVLLAEQRERADAELERAQARLLVVERLTALGQMSAGVAHHFNNLLASIIGLSEIMLRESELPDGQVEDLRSIRDRAVDGATLVARLQDLARGTRNPSEPERVDLSSVAEDVAKLCESRFCPGTAHEIVLDVAPVEPVMGAWAELRDVVMNLVVNALEAMPEGGRVRVSTRSVADGVQLQVEDGGPGIEPEIRARMFEPFVTSKDEGTGLGLSICWGVVRRLGGKLEARSSGNGTTFQIVLPAASNEVGDLALPAAREEEPAVARAAILVVDDEDRVRDVLARLLESRGHEACTAGSGEEALELLRQRSIDLVITDHDMPEMTGRELARRVAEIHPQVPVILASGWETALTVAPGDDPDVVLTIGKPVTARALARAVAHALGTRED
ncbi:MAG: ATP-binding protein [Acidobacteriota bacterium]